MIHEEKCYSVTCDNCGRTYEDVLTGFTLWPDKTEAANSACDSDWYSDGDKHYCLDCHHYDDDDNLVVHSKKKKEIRNMRSIRFRGKKVKDGQWVKGDLIQGDGINPEKMYILPSNEPFRYEWDEVYGYEVVKETVSQYTGYNDILEYPIYEGDILQYEEHNIKNMLVKWYKYDDNQGWDIFLNDRPVVIGNKWDGKDLYYYEYIDANNPKY